MPAELDPERGSERETGHLLLWDTERAKLYIFSSHLGLIRCLTPVRDSAIVYSQAFLDKHCNTTNVILPHKLKHGSCMLSKQASALHYRAVAAIDCGC